MDNNIELYTKKAELLKALSHPIRLCIVRGLLQNGGCNVSHMEHCLGASQSVISQHLAKLKAAGIVKGIRSGNEICYQIADPQIEFVIKALFTEQEEYHA